MSEEFRARSAEPLWRAGPWVRGWSSRDWSLVAANDETSFPATGPFADALFRQEGAQSLREGYVFKPHANCRGSGDRSFSGHWVCHLREHDRLTWSHEVYDLFGLPVGARVERDWAVTRYSAQSRSTLQRVREFALRHGCGFILDAEIAPDGADRRWIRVLALPEFRDGQIVRLHGRKRLLSLPNHT